MIRADVNYNAASGKNQHVITMDQDDPLAHEIVQFVASVLNGVERTQESDEVRKSLGRTPMTAPSQGTEPNE